MYKKGSCWSQKILISFIVFPLDVDLSVWNRFIQQLGESDTYFSVKWLYAECYLYRRLKLIFEKRQV